MQSRVLSSQDDDPTAPQQRVNVGETRDFTSIASLTGGAEGFVFFASCDAFQNMPDAHEALKLIALSLPG